MLQKIIHKAKVCYQNQRRRCYYVNNPRYKDNGAKGITVDYTWPEFRAWYLENYQKYKGNNPSVGRIDHSKSYNFNNIRFESIEDNSIERIQRVGPTKPRRKVIIHDCISGEDIFIAESCKDAAELTGINSKHISKYCRGELKKSANNFALRYLND